MEKNQAVGSRARIIYARETSWGEVPTDIQSVTIDGDGGTFKLDYDGQVTSDIAYNAIASAVQTALRDLSTIGTNVTCTGGPLNTNPVVCNFLSPSGIQAPSRLIVNTNAVTLGSDDGTVTILNTPNFRSLRLMPGTDLQPGFATYKSGEIRKDRTMAKTNIGTQRPTFSLPFEMSPEGWLSFWWHVLGDDVTTTAGPVNEVQTLSITGTPTGGTFKLEFGGEITAAIAYNANAAAVQSALQALTSIGSGNATCAGGALPGTPVTITFVSDLAGSNQPLISVARNLLTGGTDPQIAIDVTTHGVPSGAYRHVIKATVSLPVGFMLEQGHDDLDPGTERFFGFVGGRVDGMSLNWNIDQHVSGTLTGMFREAFDPSDTSFNEVLDGDGNPVDPAIPSEDPFTSVQVSLLEGATLRELFHFRQSTLNISNSYDGEAGFVLGSNVRQHLKPGTRSVTGSGTAFFDSADLMLKAKNSTETKLKYFAVSGAYSMEVLLPGVRLLPVGGIWPSIQNDRAIPISFNFEAHKDGEGGSYLETDIQVTLVVPEASIKA